MGRTVSTPSRAALVAFETFDAGDGDCFDPYEEWASYKECITERAANAWPSLKECGEFVGREDFALLQNSHAFFGVSEYCGLVSIWFLPKAECPLASRWLDQIEPRFSREFGTLRRTGLMSNGVAVFRSTA